MRVSHAKCVRLGRSDVVKEWTVGIQTKTLWNSILVGDQMYLDKSKWLSLYTAIIKQNIDQITRMDPLF